jgi:hypothetical protein
MLWEREEKGKENEKKLISSFKIEIPANPFKLTSFYPKFF